MSSIESQVTIVNLNDAMSSSDVGHESSHSCSTTGSSVSFSTSLVFVEPTLHLNDYTDEERSATWYNREEFMDMKMHRRRIVQLMQTGQAVDECTRGLENKTRDGSTIRQMDIFSSVGAVLDEQDTQEFSGTFNPEALAYVYTMYSHSSQRRAQERAMKDQMEAFSTIQMCC